MVNSSLQTKVTGCQEFIQLSTPEAISTGSHEFTVGQPYAIERQK
ncbi:MAG: hypothetical protein AB1861_01340 [Cyanobacteriota bacterium]